MNKVEQKQGKQHYQQSQSGAQSEELYTFYCNVCGIISLVLSYPLDQLYRRRTDQAYIVECDKVFHKKYLFKDKLTVIRRENGLEKQYKWVCKDCNQVIGYQTYDFQEGDEMNGPGIQGKTQEKLRQDKEQRKHFYIKANALVNDASQSELLKQTNEQ